MEHLEKKREHFRNVMLLTEIPYEGCVCVKQSCQHLGLCHDLISIAGHRSVEFGRS